MLVNYQNRNLISLQTREAPAYRVFLCPDLCPPHFNNPLSPSADLLSDLSHSGSDREQMISLKASS